MLQVPLKGRGLLRMLDMLTFNVGMGIFLLLKKAWKWTGPWNRRAGRAGWRGPKGD